MTRLRRLLVTTSVAIVALMAPATVHGAPDAAGDYLVQPGDYLFGIAREHGVTIGALLRANDLAITSVIHPGQRLTIPAPTQPSPGRGTYIVRSGDHLYGIARRRDVPLRSLLNANGLTLTSVIHPGQRLTIPAPTSSPSPSTYIVRSGDHLYGIARRLGVPVRSLLNANGLNLTSVIHPGQRLTIPAAARPPAPATRPTAGSPLSPSTVERIIRDVWPDALEETALAIAWRESRYQPAADSECCAGLSQLYYDVHKGWLAELGIDSRDDLHDPRTNAEAALALYQRAGGWGPWSLAGA